MMNTYEYVHDNGQINDMKGLAIQLSNSTFNRQNA